MKKMSLLSCVCLSMAFSLTAQAHGTLASQAAQAVLAASSTFNATATRDTQRLFKSVHVELTGHEQYAVQITLTSGQATNYNCTENEEVSPAVWECK